MSCPDGSGTVWPVQPFPGTSFSGWNCERRLRAKIAWDFFEKVESADAATRVQLSGHGWKPPKSGAFSADPTLWYSIGTNSNRMLYLEGQRLHQQMCPSLDWTSQRSLGISSSLVTNVYP
jgi:hypothetical protein